MCREEQISYPPPGRDKRQSVPVRMRHTASHRHETQGTVRRTQDRAQHCKNIPVLHKAACNSWSHSGRTKTWTSRMGSWGGATKVLQSDLLSFKVVLLCFTHPLPVRTDASKRTAGVHSGPTQLPGHSCGHPDLPLLPSAPQGCVQDNLA